MGRRGRLAALAAVALVVTACTGASAGGGPTSPASQAGQPGQTDDSDTTWNGLTAPLGQSVTFDSGLTVLVSRPARWRAPADAAGVDPRGVTLTVAVTLTNGQSQAYDATGLTADAFVGADSSTPCAKVHSDRAGVWQPVPPSVLPGGSGRMTLGFSCPGSAGRPLVVDVTPQTDFAPARFTGSLP